MDNLENPPRIVLVRILMVGMLVPRLDRMATLRVMIDSMMRMTVNRTVWPNWSSWHVTQVGVIVAAIGIAALLASWHQISRRQKRLLSLSLLATVLLLTSEVQALSMSSYPSHMIEHIIVVLLIAPLVASATTITLSRPMSTVGFFAFTLLVPLFHLTPLGSWVMQYPEGHYVELDDVPCRRRVVLDSRVWQWQKP